MYKKANYKYKDLKKAQDRKKRRLFNRIYELLKTNSDLIFLTFTFSDESLKKQNQQTRLRYIKQYLTEQADYYILNCDYGKTTKREHYHAIIKPKKYLIDYRAYKNGYLHGERINRLKRFKKMNKSIEEIAEYLTLHATKSSTKESRIIYSRITKTFNRV